MRPGLVGFACSTLMSCLWFFKICDASVGLFQTSCNAARISATLDHDMLHVGIERNDTAPAIAFDGVSLVLGQGKPFRRVKSNFRIFK